MIFVHHWSSTTTTIVCYKWYKITQQQLSLLFYYSVQNNVNARDNVIDAIFSLISYCGRIISNLFRLFFVFLLLLISLFDHHNHHHPPIVPLMICWQFTKQFPFKCFNDTQTQTHNRNRAFISFHFFLFYHSSTTIYIRK